MDIQSLYSSNKNENSEQNSDSGIQRTHLKKPEWLKIKLGGTEQFTLTKNIVESHQLHTICSSGKCPNMGECWDRGTATFMIGGEICTRSCKFCNTLTGKPLPLNSFEPNNVAHSVKLMNLKHAVITSVDRDDLPDLGANHWVQTIEAIRKDNPNTTIEILVPKFLFLISRVGKNLLIWYVRQNQM